MTIEQLRSAHRAIPFKPFVIHVADGRSFRVDHPEFLISTPSGRTIVVVETDETLQILDLLLVTGLELAPNAEGPAKRRKSSS